MDGDDRELMRRYRDGGDAGARAAMIERHLPLARRLALRYRRTSEPLDDLVQVASLGLVKAVDRWDPDRGYTLATFAVPTILGELRRYFRDATWLVRPPRQLRELASSLEEARRSLRAALGREPTAADLAARLGRAPEAVVEALHAAAGRASCTLEGPALQIGAHDAGYEQAEARVAMGQLTARLDRRAREILRLRFGEDLLQTEVAARVGCSQMQVSRVIRSSLEELGDAASDHP
jgi:RNA polymerase sigma-B factor